MQKSTAGVLVCSIKQALSSRRAARADAMAALREE
jgi:hypothetical protein